MFEIPAKMLHFDKFALIFDNWSICYAPNTSGKGIFTGDIGHKTRIFGGKTELSFNGDLNAGDAGEDLTTKGDLHGFDTENTRIPVGADGHGLNR